jgi:predicted nucleic acid-binding protein
MIGRSHARNRHGHERSRCGVEIQTRASYRLLETISDSRWRLNMSTALALEYESVAKREGGKLGIPAAAIDDIVDLLCDVSHHHAIYFKIRPELTDPDDDFVLELAVAAGCDFIVTHNIRHFQAARRFGIRAVTPGEFLRTMEVR